VPTGACGSTDTHTCTAVDYANRIYDSRRRNFWSYACPWQFATGNATFAGCRLQTVPNARTTPQLTYAQPNSYAEYLAGVHNTCGPSDVILSDSLQIEQDAANWQQQQQQAPISNVLQTPQRNTVQQKPIANVLQEGDKTPQQIVDSNATLMESVPMNRPFDWPERRRSCVAVGDTSRPGCRQCSIEPNCGNRDGTFGGNCAPQPPFKRRMRYNGGPVFRPASSLPALDRYQWAQPESLYWFDSPEQWADAYAGVYSSDAAPRAKFNFQNPSEQTRLWAGVPPPTKAPCASEPGERAAYSTCAQTNVPYYRNYLESKYACGCNRQRCTRQVATSQGYCRPQ